MILVLALVWDIGICVGIDIGAGIAEVAYITQFAKAGTAAVT